jgi:hypothetical protein
VRWRMAGALPFLGGGGGEEAVRRGGGRQVKAVVMAVIKIQPLLAAEEARRLSQGDALKVGLTVGRFSMDGRWAVGRCGMAARVGRWRRLTGCEEGGTASCWMGLVGGTGRVVGWADWAESLIRIPFETK